MIHEPDPKLRIIKEVESLAIIDALNGYGPSETYKNDFVYKDTYNSVIRDKIGKNPSSDYLKKKLIP